MRRQSVAEPLQCPVVSRTAPACAIEAVEEGLHERSYLNALDREPADDRIQFERLKFLVSLWFGLLFRNRIHGFLLSFRSDGPFRQLPHCRNALAATVTRLTFSNDV